LNVSEKVLDSHDANLLNHSIWYKARLKLKGQKE